MKITKLNMWIVLVMMSLIFCILAACSADDATGTKPSDGNTTPAPGNEGKTPAEDTGPTTTAETIEPAEVIFYSTNNDPVESFDYRFGDSLRAKFPHHTIDYMQAGDGRRLNDLVTSGIPFDIYFTTIGNFEGTAFPYSIEYDMTELIKQFDVDLARFEPTIIQAIQASKNGEMFALPVFTTNLVTYYNKDIFDQFGEDYPVDGMSWDEMGDLANRLSRNVENQQYFGHVFSWLHTLRMNPMSIPNADLETHSPTVNTDDRWNSYYENIYIKPTSESSYNSYIQANGLPSFLDMFVKEKNAAMLTYLSSLIYVWEEEMSHVNFDWVSYPTIEDGVGSQSYPAYFGITQMARSKEASMEVLAYLVSDEFQTELARKAIMPVVENESVLASFGEESPYSDRNLAAAYYNKFAPIPPKAPFDSQLVSTYAKYFGLAIKGEMDFNTARRIAHDESVQLIEEYRKNNE